MLWGRVTKQMSTFSKKLSQIKNSSIALGDPPLIGSVTLFQVFGQSHQDHPGFCKV